MIKLRKDNYRTAIGVLFDCFLIVLDHTCDLLQIKLYRNE